MLLTFIGVLPVAAAESDLAFFESKIRPLLIDHCHSCHSVKSGKQKGGLLLDSRAALLKGGDIGPGIVPGKPAESLLIKAVSYHDPELEMPPKERLSAAQVASLTTWIQSGAAWPQETAPKSGTKHDEPVAVDPKVHWAWSPIRVSEPPAVRDQAWAKTPIDRFILAKLEEAKLRPAPEADRRTLIRRAAFALTGLPPTIAEVDAFLADTSASAFERVVDHYLASPAFGERWARHWLDLVRYAETRGHEFDARIANAWQYRDYVIRALNADVPYNRFVQEHIAGDLLTQPRLHPQTGADEAVLATGFWFLGETIHSPVDIRQDEADRIDNQIDVMGKTFMGLTIGCARCHDHKFDPITAQDYYALGGIVQSSNYRQVRFESDQRNRAVAERLWKLRSEREIKLRAALAASLQDGVTAIARYLLASLEVNGGKGNGPEEVAARNKLDLPRFAAWLKHLTAISDNPSDPFHAWSRLMRLPAAERAAAVGRIHGEVVAGQHQSVERWTTALAASTVLVDYSKPNEPWLPDGVAFGPKATPVGSLRFGANAAKPELRIADRAAAYFDPVWQRLGVDADSANDYGALDMPRAGRTLRTRTIDLGEGTVHVLLRGKGLLYAAVGSHTLIHGPLHGALVRKVDGKTAEWRWERLDLRAYPGHRCHLEFTADSADFAVAMVVQGENPPVLPLPAPITTAEVGIPAFAAAHRAAFAAALKSKVGDEAAASLTTWLLEHPELVGEPEAELFSALAKDQAVITADIRDKSHLALGIMDGDGADWRVLIRGSPRNMGPVAPRGLPVSVFGKQPPITQGSGRREIAERMTNPKSNPFVSRVMANRIWHHLMGRGIVASVDNFGALGDKPSHPELLDHLATRFVADGWSVKRLIRSIMLSATWRMSSAADTAQDSQDPGNLLLHRANLRRLDGEAIRDALLALSGRLDPAMYGPSIPIHLSDFMTGRGRPNGGPLDGKGRRSIYQAVWRNFLSPMMLAFDTPIPFNTMGKRASSNVPAQALILMNDPFVQQQAELWAKKVGEQQSETPARIALFYRMAFAREPLPNEVAAAQGFLGAMPDGRAWSDLAHALVTTKEFTFIQ